MLAVNFEGKLHGLNQAVDPKPFQAIDQKPSILHADLKRLAEELEGLQRAVMRQREVAAKERDAEREQNVRAIVAACEKVRGLN